MEGEICLIRPRLVGSDGRDISTKELFWTEITASWKSMIPSWDVGQRFSIVESNELGSGNRAAGHVFD